LQTARKREKLNKKDRERARDREMEKQALTKKHIKCNAKQYEKRIYLSGKST